MDTSHRPLTADDIRERIVALLAEILERPREEIGEDAALDEDLGLESVAFLELQVTLEDELGIQIDPVEVVERNRLGAIAAYIHALLPAERA